MRRCLCSLLLFAGIVSISRADYVLIRVAVDAAVDPQKKMEGGEGNVPPPMDMGNGQNPDLKVGEYLLVVVDAKREAIEVKEFGRRKIPFLTHHLGRTADFFDAKEISFQYVSPKVIRPPLAQYTAKKNALTVERKDKNPDSLLDLARWCVEIGLLDKGLETLGEIEKALAAKDAGKPSENVARAMAAYTTIKPILSAEIPGKTRAEAWKQRLKYGTVATSRHYALVHNTDDPKRDGVEDKLKALEQNFRTVYLLFALKGRALPAPREKLVAVLANDNDVYRKAARVFEAPDQLTDGFHGPRENVVVFSNMRLDRASQLFEGGMRGIHQTYSVDLLKGQFRPLKKAEKQEDVQANLDANNRQVQADARAQVLALVEALLREEADTAAATQEGSRQLLVEIGMLPANVDLPEWLRFGLASVFSQPKGPFPLKAKDTPRVAFHPSAGAANWEWRRILDEMVKDNLIPDDPTEALLDTLLDVWKDKARAALAKPREEGDMRDPAAEAELEISRGRALAWALCFYLFNERFDELQKFGEALNRLPRDIELDRSTFLKVFCESFGIPTEGLTPANLRGNAAGYEAFAKDWVKAIRNAPLPAVNVKWEEIKEKKDDPNNPMPKGNGG